MFKRRQIMNTFPGSSRLITGAIIGADKFNPRASVIVFQYNPDTVTRRLEARRGRHTIELASRR
jgi:hypothetical protein